MKIFKLNIIKYNIILLVCFLCIGLNNIIFAQDKKSIAVSENQTLNESVEERYALIIGINEYKHIKSLKYAGSDSTMIGDILRESGLFTVVGIGDDFGTEATKQNIMNALYEIEQKSLRGELKSFVFYFTGHGFNINGNDYIAPVGVHLNDIKNTSVSMPEVFSIIKSIQRSTKVILFLDACRNDPYQKKDIMETPWQTENNQDEDIKIIYSTDKHNYSYELEELEHGVYTLYLSQALKGLADTNPFGDENGYTNFDEITKYMIYSMNKFSDENPYNIKQNPLINMAVNKSDFFVTKVRDVELIPTKKMIYFLQNNKKVNETEYSELINPIFEKIEKEINELKIKEAISTCSTALDIIDEYKIIVDTNEHKQAILVIQLRLRMYLKAEKYLEKGKYFEERRNYKNSVYSYSTAFMLIRDYKLEDFNVFDMKSLQETITIMRYSKNAEEIIGKADELLRKKKEKEAISQYETALMVVKNHNLQNYISEEEIKEKIKKVKTVIYILESISEANYCITKKEFKKAENIYTVVINLIEEFELEEFLDITTYKKIYHYLKDFYFGISTSFGIAVLNVSNLFTEFTMGFDVGVSASFSFSRYFAIGTSINISFSLLGDSRFLFTANFFPQLKLTKSLNPNTLSHSSIHISPIFLIGFTNDFNYLIGGGLSIALNVSSKVIQFYLRSYYVKNSNRLFLDFAIKLGFEYRRA